MLRAGLLRTDTVVIGGGHAGLAVSRCLNDQGIDHVVLERATVANSWKTERWNSLRLLTPNWQSRLPGFSYEGDDPNGFMKLPEVINFIERYAEYISVPIELATNVTEIYHRGAGYQITTNHGSWICRSLVLATGACNVANVPSFTSSIPPSINELTPLTYQIPDELVDGGVLIVGASATGVQLAYEIQNSGRPVTLSVGEHVRMPRTYRDRDILWWMDAAGILDESYTEIDDIHRARNLPSPQLSGSLKQPILDLNALCMLGVKIVGRLAGVTDSKIQFAGSLRNNCKLADLKMNRLLKTIDDWAVDHDLDVEVEPSHRFQPTAVEAAPPLELELSKSQIRTIVWATGFRPDYSWLKLPVFDHKGKIRHDGGIVESPGMYLVGMNFLRRRKSSFIHGVEDDARELSDHLVKYLARS